MNTGNAFYAGLLEALTSVMGSAKGYLRDHGPMVAMLASQIGRELGLSKAECSEIFFAAVLSDMGMVGLAEDAWENPAPTLTADVRERVEMHPRRSEERVRGIPHLEDLAPLLRHHHEWWDGSGYPDGLRGEDIPVGARILRLADTVAALGQKRPHRGPLEPDAVQEIDPYARLAENFDQQFESELNAKDRWADVQSKSRNLFGSFDKLSRA